MPQRTAQGCQGHAQGSPAGRVMSYYSDDMVTLYHGDNRDILASLPDASVDACVTDPPYELGFMGKGWDGSGIAYDAALWSEVLRVLKPGGHLLAFGGTRTWHRLACAIEDASFEVRDSLAWMYGSGFPKSLDISKAIDKGEGHWRGKAGEIASENGAMSGANYERTPKGDPITDAAKQWQGWGTALKPAFEPVVVARKPLIGTVAANVQAHGTGALNIDASRIGMSDDDRENINGRTWVGRNQYRDGEEVFGDYATDGTDQPMGAHRSGRWPANVILDESQADELDRQSGVTSSRQAPRGTGEGETATYGSWGMADDDTRGHDDRGGASRFFYTAKASTVERPRVDDLAHPTVKPLDLIRYLVRLVTPPGGTVLEPFAGSGTTAEACIVEGFKCIAIELTEEYLPLIVQRISKPIEVTLL